MRILDRYLLREWLRLFALTVVGLPVLVSLIDLTEKLDRYLSRGITRKAVALSYFYGLPDLIVLVLPVAVLFATVFTVSALGRHSEITAAKASGQSFHRLIRPVFFSAAGAALLGFLVGEMAAPAATRRLELLGDKQIRSRPVRSDFVYRSDGGWVYVVRSLEIAPRAMREVLLQRRGTGVDYPTVVVTARQAHYVEPQQRWVLADGQVRLLAGPNWERAFRFDSLVSRAFRERPADLLAEPKWPEEMRYAELQRYVNALERSGAEARKLKVDLALKLSIPFACLVIAAFGAPLAMTSHRAGPAYGVAVSLTVTALFLLSFQISKAVGASGLMPPTFAAWLPNLVNGGVAVWLLKKAPT